MHRLPLGSNLLTNRTASFNVWAPFCQMVQLKVLSLGKPPVIYPMQNNGNGYFSFINREIKAGDLYHYVLDGNKERPDPCSRYQPEGVHGPTCIVDPKHFKWRDGKWKGIALKNTIFYELHVGTFTQKGTFEAAIQKIPYLKKLGITCVEIMPVSQFPGVRNWGYDGVGLYAVQNSYGGSVGLKKLVNACHQAGLAVCLDVVYNHFGPEGNYLNDFGPYFTKKYSTPWGDAINYDDDGSKEVRHFVVENSLYWITEFHMDMLRLDAVHGIFDRSKRHILEELNDRVQACANESGKQVHIIAESDLNDSKIIRRKKRKGYGLAGQWSDDFHHAVHAYLVKERTGYYKDFGSLKDIQKAIQSGFVYDGKYSVFRKKRHGNSVRDLPPEKLVTCIQNHDQIGNRAFGDRLSALISFEYQKIAAVLLLISHHTPLLFMGQEYGEKNPFQYFIDHSDRNLIQAVRRGRLEEFRSFGWARVPDPQSKHTFERSRLSWNISRHMRSQFMLRLYQDLIQLRKLCLKGEGFRIRQVSFSEKNRWLWIKYRTKGSNHVHVVTSFSKKPVVISGFPDSPLYRLLIRTNALRYGGRKKINGLEFDVHTHELKMEPETAIVVSSSKK